MRVSQFLWVLVSFGALECVSECFVWSNSSYTSGMSFWAFSPLKIWRGFKRFTLTAANPTCYQCSEPSPLMVRCALVSLECAAVTSGKETLMLQGRHLFQGRQCQTANCSITKAWKSLGAGQTSISAKHLVHHEMKIVEQLHPLTDRNRDCIYMNTCCC